METVTMIGRLLVSLGAVLGLIWVIARRARKGAGLRGKGERVLEVLDRTSLSRSASVAVVRVGDQAFVLGVADATVSVLGETDLAAAQAARDARTAPRRARAHAATGRPAVAARVTPSVALPAAPVARTAARPAAPAAETPAAHTGPLAGSALSPQTWRQTIESLRDLTSRS